jgi:GNAT superfamily N-acetyltransferase
MTHDYEIDVAGMGSLRADELSDLYGSVGWTAYTSSPDALAAAVANSSYVVVARSGGRLIGLARVVSDDVSICYLQDVLVRPEWQRRGVGRALVARCLARYIHVRNKVLLTDEQAGQHEFYRALGYEDVSGFRAAPLRAFVRIEGLEEG